MGSVVSVAPSDVDSSDDGMTFVLDSSLRGRFGSALSISSPAPRLPLSPVGARPEVLGGSDVVFILLLPPVGELMLTPSNASPPFNTGKGL